MAIKNVNHYYSIFLRYINSINNFYQNLSKEYESYKDRKIVCDENLIKSGIQGIIDANYSHILTSSFINFLVDVSNEEGTIHFEESLEFNLKAFNNQYERLETIIYFIDRSTDNDYYNLTDYESEICSIFQSELKKTSELYKVDLIEYYFMKDVFLVIAAQAILDHKPKEELIRNLDYYINNWKDCLDDISMQIPINLLDVKNQYKRNELLDLLVGRVDNSYREIR